MRDVSRIHVERNSFGGRRITLDDSSGLFLVGYIDHLKRMVESGEAESERAGELFRRELRLLVPESAVR